MEKFITTRRLAEKLGVSRQYIALLVKQGKIKPSINVDDGHLFLFSIKNVKSILSNGKWKVRKHFQVGK